MIGTAHCTYETPCGWCTKWDKKCDEKMPEPYTKPYDYLMKAPTNQICKSEEDHQWECCGISTAGSTYRCKVCGEHKTVPVERQDYIITTTTSNTETYSPCSECAHEDWDMPQCKECDASNNFKYFEGWENEK